ncbi:MAG: proline dehydrogenase family protein [bacterium]|nr:proline dehydrogenase family protein [bacterium]
MKWLLLAAGLYIVKAAAVYGIARLMFRCYVAGRTEAEALRALSILLAHGYGVTSDILGEFVKRQQKLPQILAEYTRHIASLGALKRQFPERAVALTVKPSRIGMEIEVDAFRDSLMRIAECAKRHGVFLWVDAEKLADRERTVPIVTEIRGVTGARMGMAIQSVHDSSVLLAEKLVEAGLSLRVVKGAYKDGGLSHPNDVRDCFLRIWHRAAISDAQDQDIVLATGTHDGPLIGELRLSGDPRLEVQMLYGIRMKLQEELRAAGARMHVYVPWGTYRNAYGFLFRRMREGASLSAFKLFLRNIRESREMRRKLQLSS